ncbi:hypothetical protein G2W53_028523 [Senna tora]|uniref:Putative plant transposon protein domain-containing protein n=1 Tax=Senna tora TaxID=362788 RepID=A0A834T2H2_9FABA|nr:hypothetical protein G2W53_028523 [Senna tora]
MAPPKTLAGPSKRKTWFDDTRFASAVAENRYTCLFSQSTTAIHERGVFVRGKRVPITREIIRDFYKLPDVHVDIDCAYVALMTQPEEELNYDELGNNLRRKAELGSNPWKKDSKGQYNNFLLTNLSVTARSWLHFLSCRLLPGSHRTEVTKDRVLLINCLITKQPIDAAQIILNQLTSMATKKLPGREQTPNAPTLAFPALITSLCKRAGVAMPPTEDQYHQSQMATIERNHLFVVGELENVRQQGEHNQECLQVVHLNLLALICQWDGTDPNPATRPFSPRPGGLR